MEMATKRKILIIGSGSFGSCLADHLCDASDGNEVYIYSRSQAVIDSLNNYHKNPRYLTHHTFHHSLKAVGPDLAMLSPEYLATFYLLLFAIPTQSMRPILLALNLPAVHPLPLLCFVNKGIEENTNLLPLEVVEQICGQEISKVACVLSGPSFANEIVDRQPTQVSVASFSPVHSDAIAHLFHRPHFRAYVNSDPIGVELCGALKNIYAIASGVAVGLGYASNTRAGLVTRSLNELMRIGKAYNADPLTFLSLAGVGDLFLTCSSEKSRNFTVGFRLGQGESLEHIIESLGSVAEGVVTTKSAYAMTREKGIDAPILEHVYQLLWENGSAKGLAIGLLNLPRQNE